MSIIEDDRNYQPVNRHSARTPFPMKSSTSSQQISNPFHPNSPLPTDEETSTYSFRHITKKLQHAKSHGELYQPHAPLPLPPMTKINTNENEIKYRQKYSLDSPQSSTSMRARAGTTATTTTVPIITRPTTNPSNETFNSSSSYKIPLWKRFKKIIAPPKRTKEQRNSSGQIPILQSNQSSINETSKTFYREIFRCFFDMTFEQGTFTS